MFLIFFCLAAGVYVFGTVGYKFKVQDARGGDLVRPSRFARHREVLSRQP